METNPQPELGAPDAPAARASRGRSAGRFLLDHPIGVVQAVFFALITVIVLQNLEPTSLDVLFWSIPGLPKLVLVVVAMAIGGLVWEVLRRRLFR